MNPSSMSSLVVKIGSADACDVPVRMTSLGIRSRKTEGGPREKDDGDSKGAGDPVKEGGSAESRFALIQVHIGLSQGSVPCTGWIRGKRMPMAGARRRSGAEEGEAAPCAADVGEVFLPRQGEW